MASENEASCDADPNFAVICSFMEKFGAACGLQAVDFVELQQMLENTQEVSPVLIDLHIKLMRKIRKSINNERWERGIVKFCHSFSNQDAWEIERFGYKKARLSAKIRLLKELLEMQFDNNTSFKNKINVITAKELRSQPLGRDKLGNAYWYQADDSCQIRVYKEDPDEETWALVAKDREGLVTLISKLSDNHDSSSTDAVTNDDSNSLEENKPILDTGQQDSNSSKKSSDEDKPPVLKQEVDDEDTKMDGAKSSPPKVMPDIIAPPVEEKKPELSGIKEKYIRSDNFVQSNRKAVESAGFVDIGNADLKRPIDDPDIEEPSLVKRPRTDRPTLLGNKKKPYQREEYDDDEIDEEEESVEEEEDEQVDEEEDDEEEDLDYDGGVGEAIEEPLMLVTGKGAGKDNKCGNQIVGEEVEEDVIYFYGEGSGRDCETGNEEKNAEEKKTDGTDSSIKSPTKNNIKLGTIIDSKTDPRKDKCSPKKASRWDISKRPDEPTSLNEPSSGSVKNLVDKFETISKEEEAPVLKKPSFFFGPSSGFTFKAPTSFAKSANMSFGAPTQNSVADKADKVSNLVVEDSKPKDISPKAELNSKNDGEVVHVNENNEETTNSLPSKGEDIIVQTTNTLPLKSEEKVEETINIISLEKNVTVVPEVQESAEIPETSTEKHDEKDNLNLLEEKEEKKDELSDSLSKDNEESVSLQEEIKIPEIETKTDNLTPSAIDDLKEDKNLEIETIGEKLPDPETSPTADAPEMEEKIDLPESTQSADASVEDKLQEEEKLGEDSSETTNNSTGEDKSSVDISHSENISDELTVSKEIMEPSTSQIELDQKLENVIPDAPNDQILSSDSSDVKISEPNNEKVDDLEDVSMTSLENSTELQETSIEIQKITPDTLITSESEVNCENMDKETANLDVEETSTKQQPESTQDSDELCQKLEKFEESTKLSSTEEQLTMEHASEKPNEDTSLSEAPKLLQSEISEDLTNETSSETSLKEEVNVSECQSSSQDIENISEIPQIEQDSKTKIEEDSKMQIEQDSENSENVCPKADITMSDAKVEEPDQEPMIGTPKSISNISEIPEDTTMTENVVSIDNNKIVQVASEQKEMATEESATTINSTGDETEIISAEEPAKDKNSSVDITEPTDTLLLASVDPEIPRSTTPKTPEKNEIPESVLPESVECTDPTESSEKNVENMESTEPTDEDTISTATPLSDGNKSEDTSRNDPGSVEISKDEIQLQELPAVEVPPTKVEDEPQTISDEVPIQDDAEKPEVAIGLDDEETKIVEIPNQEQLKIADVTIEDENKSQEDIKNEATSEISLATSEVPVKPTEENVAISEIAEETLSAPEVPVKSMEENVAISEIAEQTLSTPEVPVKPMEQNLPISEIAEETLSTPEVPVKPMEENIASSEIAEETLLTPEVPVKPADENVTVSEVAKEIELTPEVAVKPMEALPTEEVDAAFSKIEKNVIEVPVEATDKSDSGKNDVFVAETAPIALNALITTAPAEIPPKIQEQPPKHEKIVPPIAESAVESSRIPEIKENSQEILNLSCKDTIAPIPHVQPPDHIENIPHLPVHPPIHHVGQPEPENLTSLQPKPFIPVLDHAIPPMHESALNFSQHSTYIAPNIAKEPPPIESHNNFVHLEQPIAHKPLYDEYSVEPKLNMPPAPLELTKSFEPSETSHIIAAANTLDDISEPPILTPLDCIPKESSLLSYHHAMEPPEITGENYDSYGVAAGLEKNYMAETHKDVSEPVEEESVIIQEIGSISSRPDNKKPKLSNDALVSANIEGEIVPANEEEDICKIRGKAPSVLEVSVDNSVAEPPKDVEFVEIPCTKQKVALLEEEDNLDQYSDDMNYDDNISEPMELEESKEAEIIQCPESKSKQPEEPPVKEVIPDVPKEEPVKEKKVQSLQSLSLDYTGETPSLDEVHAMVKRARKRGPDEEVAQEESEGDTATGGKRRKMRGKRAVNKGMRRSIEEAKNKDVSSSDEEKKSAQKTEEQPKTEKKKGKRKRLMLGLEIPEEGVVVEAPTGLRQSRRIAQIKIKEEAERRKLEEIALEEMKEKQKKKSKKEEDKDYKAEKRKITKVTTEEETTNDAAEVEGKKIKKKKKRKHRMFDETNPWRSSSDSSTEDSHVEEEEEEEEENYIETVKSDHEFSPESDLENTQDPQPLKRARTVRKEDAEEVEDVDDTNCQKCQKSDHPEWILLCDGCDSGWHCSCLRPALLVIPEGDWYCPPCQHSSLIKLLQDKLQEFDKIQTKKETELRRKERLAYIGISLANVLPGKESQDGPKVKRERPKKREIVSGDDSESGSDSKSGSDSQSDSGSSSQSSSSSTDSDDEPIYKLRQRRQAHSYRFKDYDELINSAIQDEVEVKQQSEYQSKGKDMATIVQAEASEKKEEGKPEESDEDEIKPVKKVLGKKKHRRLNSLDISSEEDEDSDEDFKGTSSDEDEDEYEYYNDSGSSSSSLVGRKKGRGSVRRSTRARISRYDRDFINDDSEDSDEPRRKRGRSDWEESEESEESDGSWGRRKKRGGGGRRAAVTSSSKSKRKKSKKKSRDDSDHDAFRRKKPKIKFGGLDDDDGDGRRRTRGKKINYIDALGTDSEEESRRRNQAKEEESEDEFVLNEEEEDVHDDEGREDASSDDSNIAGLVPAVKKGSKKGKGKGGIKRIKRAQGEEEEALFPPLPEPQTASLAEAETNPIEQINKNLEAMDEKEIGMMMEEEEYANKQLQMVAAQLEKEKRRKELEARKLEMGIQPPIAPVVPAPIHQLNEQPSVIQTMPISTPPQVLPPNIPMQPIHHELSPMHQQPPPLQQPPQLMVPHASPGIPTSQQMMLLDATTPKKRGRKPKTQMLSPEMGIPTQPFASTSSPLSDRLDDSDASLGFNSDGSPKKRRGRGKGKKTLEKEAAAAAAASGVHGPPAPAATKAPEPEPERVPLPIEAKTTVPADIPLVGGKLGVASAPQPFAQSQPKPSVITRMLQTQPGQPAYPVGSVSHNFSERPQGPPVSQGQGPPFVPGPGGIPPRGLLPGSFRPGANHYAVIRSGAPPIRPQGMPPHLYHHPMETPSSGPPGPPITERSSPALTSPASASPLSNKSDPTPPPPPYVVRPPMVRFPPTTTGPPPTGMPPRHPQMLAQMHSRLPYPGVPPHNFHFAPPYGEGGSQFQTQGPPQYQEQFAGEADGAKNYDEENGEFGGLVSYFSSQREDDLDT